MIFIIFFVKIEYPEDSASLTHSKDGQLFKIDTMERKILTENTKNTEEGLDA